MALNPNSQSNTAVEVIDGTVSEFYNVVDQCIRKSEVMAGQYKNITSPSYSNNCPINEDSFTTVDFGCPAPQVIDVDNSFITAVVQFKVHIPTGFLATGNSSTFFIGWRSSLDAIYKYEIFCNHKTVISQSYVGEESFILQSLIPEHVRCRKPYQYTTYENASNFSPNVCGTYITLSSDGTNDAGNTSIDVEIPIKIDINQLLLFANFKYLPGFCGTWNIKIYPSRRNLIICPVNPEILLTPTEKLQYIGHDFSDYTHHFVQIGDSCSMLTALKYTAGVSGGAPTIVGPTFSDTLIYVSDYKFDLVLLHQTQFELMYDVYDALKARYMNRPLTIPINKLDFGRFAGKLSGNSSTYSAAVNNLESIFILPFADDSHHTICFNPLFTNFYLNISGLGNVPQQPIDTFGSNERHTRFVNLTLDALNINNSLIMAPNKDLLNSLETQTKKHYVRSYSGSAFSNTINYTTENHDTSNFLIGIPFSNDIDFEGGLSSFGNLNFKLTTAGNAFALPDDNPNYLSGGEIGATVMFCVDAALMIKVVPYSAQPEVRLVTEKIV